MLALVWRAHFDCKNQHVPLLKGSINAYILFTQRVIIYDGFVGEF